MSSFPNNLKCIGHYLKNIPQIGIKRPELNPNWDSVF